MFHDDDVGRSTREAPRLPAKAVRAGWHDAGVDMSGYRELLRDPVVRKILLVGFFARMPPLTAPLAFTLHVVQDLDGTYAQAGVVAAASTIGAGLGMPWRGRLIDRLGLRRAVVPSVVAVGVLYPVAAVAPYWLLVPVAFLMGVFLIPIFSVVRQSLAVLVREDLRRTAYSADSVVTEASFIIGPALGVLLVTQQGAAWALAFIGACEVVAGLVLLRLDPPTRSPGDPDTDPDAAPTTAAAPSTWLSVPVGFLFLVAAASVVTLYATDLGIVAILEDDGNTGAIALVYGLWGAASLLGGLLYGALSSSIRPSYLCMGLGLTTIPVGLADSVWVLALAVIPTGFLCAPTLTAASEWLAKLTPEERRGEAMGWLGSSHTAAAAVTAPLLGLTIDHVGPWASFAGGGAVAAAIALLVLGGQLVPRFRPVPVDADATG